MLSHKSRRFGRLSALALAALLMTAAAPAAAAEEPAPHDAAHVSKKKRSSSARKVKKKPSKRSVSAPKSAAGTAPARRSEPKLPALSHARRAESQSSPARGKKTKKSVARRTKKTVPPKSGEHAPRAHRAARTEASRQTPCEAQVLAIDRNGLEGESLTLTNCEGKPTLAARQKLSILARPWSVASPDLSTVKQHAKHVPLGADQLAPGVRLLDEALVVRLSAMAAKFPRMTLSLVSGYRPDSDGSLHQTGRAIDVRAAGVSNQELVAFCRTLPDTGCGHYPNSSFLHIDVREPGAGSAHWIDASGPGEPPHYVSEWPLKTERTEHPAPAKAHSGS